MKKSAEYMMILRNTDWDAELTTEEIAATIGRYHEWVQRLSGESVLGGGRPLLAGGRVISMESNGNVTDGPFVETKEVIGGYIVINAASIEEATEIAKTSRHSSAARRSNCASWPSSVLSPRDMRRG